MILFYGYDKCSTCRKAKAWLDARKIAVKKYDITQTPPSKTILETILKSGNYPLGALFNRSGQLYRQMQLKNKLEAMSPAEMLDLLSKHGKLVKRPVITDGRRHTVGFDEAVMSKTWR